MLNLLEPHSNNLVAGSCSPSARSFHQLSNDSAPFDPARLAAETTERCFRDAAHAPTLGRSEGEDALSAGDELLSFAHFRPWCRAFCGGDRSTTGVARDTTAAAPRAPQPAGEIAPRGQDDILWMDTRRFDFSPTT
jgi:hypothetical protein